MSLTRPLSIEELSAKVDTKKMLQEHAGYASKLWIRSAKSMLEQVTKLIQGLQARLDNNLEEAYVKLLKAVRLVYFI